jgi:predicted FMN-binding regulatory protein PaiB
MADDDLARNELDQIMGPGGYNNMIALLSSQIDFNAEGLNTAIDDGNGNEDFSVLLLCAKLEFPILLETLLQGHEEKHINLNIQNSDGNTPLMIAVINNRVNNVSLLIQAGANLNIQNFEGNTALMLAVINNRVNIVSLLIRAGADLNIIGRNGVTPLMVATRNNNFGIMRDLIEAGADINFTSERGENVASIARGQDSQNILEQYGIPEVPTLKQRSISILGSVPIVDEEPNHFSERMKAYNARLAREHLENVHRTEQVTKRLEAKEKRRVRRNIVNELRRRKVDTGSKLSQIKKSSKRIRRKLKELELSKRNSKGGKKTKNRRRSRRKRKTIKK